MSTDVEFSISTDKVWKHRPKTHDLNMSSNWRREGVTSRFDKDDLGRSKVACWRVHC